MAVPGHMGCAVYELRYLVFNSKQSGTHQTRNEMLEAEPPPQKKNRRLIKPNNFRILPVQTQTRICRRPGYIFCKAQCHFPPLCRLYNTPSSERPDLSPLAPRPRTPNSHPSDPSRAVRLVDLVGPDLARWLRFRVGPTSPTLYQPCKSLTHTNERCQRKKIHCPTRVWQP